MMSHRTLLSVTLSATILGASAPAALAQDTDGPHIATTVVARDAEIGGEPYEHWIRAYGRWFFWDRTTEDPPPDATQDCDGGQPGGPVFFIPHTQIGKTTSYACSARSDQHVLLWLGGTLGWVEDGQTAADRLAQHYGRPSHLHGFEFTVDGQTVPAGDQTIFQPALHTVELAEDNVFGLTAGPRDVFVNGSFVMLEPLSPGEHEITVRNRIFDPEHGTADAIAISRVTVTDATARGASE